MTASYVAIIPDGNGRWARAHNLPSVAGHQAGADTLSRRLYDAIAFGIRELTVYSFSTENWSRSLTEVRDLLAMLAQRIAVETPGLNQAGIHLRFIGRRDGLPHDLVQQMQRAETLTANNTTLSLFIALNYGARAEILDAAARFRGDSDENLRRCFYAPEMHDPELLIRTGGEQRLSNFLLWQCANTELVFRDEAWPDFDRQSFYQALHSPQQAQGRGEPTATSPIDRCILSP